jgi:hypothetical protein
MNHAEAEATGAIDRYVLNDMDEPDALRFEEHYFECADCAEEVRIATIFMANLQTVLREPYAVAKGADGERSRRHRTWMPQMAMAAALLLAVGMGYQNIVQIPQLRQEVEMANAIESPPVYQLLPETRSSGDNNIVVAQAGMRHVSLLLNNIPGKVYPYYECQLRDQEDKIVRSFRVKVMNNAEQWWQAPLALRGLAARKYTLQVRGAADATGPATQDVAEYHFQLEIR